MSALTPLMTMHSASVETLTGPSPTGDLFAAPVVVPGFLDDTQALAPAPGGTQLVSQTKFYAAADRAALFTPGSRVACNGRVMHVSDVHRRDGSGVFAAVAHVEVDLT